MANTIQVLDHGHLGFAGNAFDQTFAATGNDHVDIALHFQHFANSSTVRCFDHLHNIL